MGVFDVTCIWETSNIDKIRVIGGDGILPGIIGIDDDRLYSF